MPRPTVVVTLAALALALAVPPAAHAGCGGVQTGAPRHSSIPGGPPLAIGDSTMLLALPDLVRRGFAVDAHGCRQWDEALGVLRHRRHAGTLPHLVVVALGADGSVTPADIRKALAILGPDRHLTLVTPIELGGGSGQDAVVVRRAGHRSDGRVDVLDWVTYSRGHGGWFQPDGLHLTFPGAAAFARFLGHAFVQARPYVKLAGALAVRADDGARARVPFELRLTLPRGWRVIAHSERFALPKLTLRRPGPCAAVVDVSSSGYLATQGATTAQRLAQLQPVTIATLRDGVVAARRARWAAWTTPAPLQIAGALTRNLGDPFPHDGDTAERAFVDVRASASRLQPARAACVRDSVFAVLGRLARSR